MKEYLILKDFTGSQTGLDFHQFTAGKTSALSDDLANQAVAAGWAKLAKQGTPTAKVEDVSEVVESESRETKVAGPEETKVEEAEEVKTKKKGK